MNSGLKERLGALGPTALQKGHPRRVQSELHRVLAAWPWPWLCLAQPQFSRLHNGETPTRGRFLTRGGGLRR